MPWQSVTIRIRFLYDSDSEFFFGSCNYSVIVYSLDFFGSHRFLLRHITSWDVLSSSESNCRHQKAAHVHSWIMQTFIMFHHVWSLCVCIEHPWMHMNARFLREPGRCKESEHIRMPKYGNQIGCTNHCHWSARFSSIVLNFETEKSMSYKRFISTVDWSSVEQPLSRSIKGF